MALPTAQSPPPAMARTYRGDESIVLVGFVGAGKKTLGVIASMSLQRAFVDFDVYFERHVGSFPADYIASRGLQQYRTAEYEVTERLLSQHPTGCVITGLGGMGSDRQRVQLQKFAQTHPVIHVKRDIGDIQRVVDLPDDKFSRLYRIGRAFFESCSNWEFYNITQALTDNLGRSDQSIHCHLRLKDTERVFLRFLRHVFGQPMMHGAYSRHPLSSTHTYALQVPLSWLESPSPRYEELDCGADCLSLVIDTLSANEWQELPDRIGRQVSILRQYARSPVMIDMAFTPLNRKPHHAALFRSIVRVGADLIAVSLSNADDVMEDLIAQKGASAIVGTYRFSKTEQGWQDPSLLSLVERAATLKFDAMRIFSDPPGLPEQTAVSLGSLAFLQRIGQSSGIPVIAYEEGLGGRASICLNPTLSPVVLSSSSDCGVTLDQAQRAVYSCFLRPARKFTIFGSSISYSLSPEMHNAAFSACGMPHTYSALQSDRFEDVHGLFQDAEHGGVVISLPYKSHVLPLLDYISPEARDIQAVNTVLVVREGDKTLAGRGKVTLKGYNTDYIGIRDCIDRYLSPANIVRRGSTALIIGAGGMARAAIYACHKLGVMDIVVHNRTVERARALSCAYHEWAECQKPPIPLKIHVIESLEDSWPPELQQPTIVVSCIPANPVDSRPAPNLTLPEAWLQSKTGGVLIELAYRPIQTPLVKQIQERASRGWAAVDGLQVLVEQGIAQYELFTGRPAPVRVMKEVIRRYRERHV